MTFAATRRIAVAWLVGVALGAAGCGDGSLVTPGGGDIESDSTFGGIDAGKDATPPDATPDALPDTAPDVAGDEGAGTDAGGDTGECGGEFGCPCFSNAGCLDELCIDGPDGKLCTKTCSASCPDGFDCVNTTAFGPDPISICVPRHVRLCRPCQADADCQSPADGGGLCLPAPNPADGSFCGSSCEGGMPCPSGYACAPVTLPGGGESKQCVPTSGECACRPSWAAMNLTTTCAIANAHGSCAGTRTCGPSGLTSCEGAIPAAETCNGNDDDCDGTVDDVAAEVCNLVGEHGTCPGTTACDASGAEICVGQPAVAEVCNGKDDDCDGQTDEATCDDGLACTTDTCTGDAICKNTLTAGWCLIAGECVTEGTVNPADPCEQCLPAKSTNAWSDVDGLACNDGNACTWQDQCLAGACTGTPYVCNDGLACTNDVCDGTGGCLQTLVAGSCLIDGKCFDDGASQTAGGCLVCNAALSPKAWLSNAGAGCDDGNPCTHGDVCNDNTCAGTAYGCDDGNACTIDACKGDGTCSHVQAAETCIIDGECVPKGTPKPGEPCLACRPEVSGSVWSPVAPGSACDDGLPCTSGDKCTAGLCQGTPYVCNDGLTCTDDACDGGGGCTHTPKPGMCAIDGACYAQDATAPANTCQYCNAAVSPTAWSLKALGSACNDGQSCTTGDQCDSTGQCKGVGLDCNDGLACTVDTCDGLGGCVHTPQNACVIGGVCYAAGATKPGEPCQTCNPAVSTSAWTAGSGASCDDGNLCTYNDKCVSGVCVGTSKPCNDSLTCTDDVCDGNGGCSFPIKANHCLIGGVCYTNGTSNPSNVCQRCSSSVFNTQWSDNNGVTCSDANTCTSGDTCQSGVCAGSPILDSFEANNTSGAAKSLGSASDCDDWPKGSFTATIYPSGDVDYYKFTVSDDLGCSIWPRVELTSMPSGANYNLCVTYTCNKGTTKLDCDVGTKVGSNTCCSTNAGSVAEVVRINPNCDCGTFCTDDSGTAVVEVKAGSGSALTCEPYTLNWGDL